MENTAWKKLKAWLDSKGLKQSRWAMNHGIDPAAITRLKQGKILSARNYKRIATATNGDVSYTDLIG